jgi:beta-barrel assembly-enhancing protease
MRCLLCLATLALGFAQGQERQPGQSADSYSKDKEVAVGRQLAQEFRGKTTPLGSAAANDYVRRVAADLAAQLPGRWSYEILTIRDNLGGATHEPIAFPEGSVFVSADLISAARNEAEFAGMLAHAMAHVAARHWARSATKSELVIPNGWLIMPDGWPHSMAPIGMLATQRSIEAEADYLAVKAMAAAGYDPAGLALYVARVQPASGKGAVSAVFEPLPPRDRRVAAIQAEIRQLPAGSYRASDEFARVQFEVKALALSRPAPTLFNK